MQQWTDDEVYAELARQTQIVDGQPVLTLAAIETVLFDPRFPPDLEPQARALLERMKAIAYKGPKSK